ncbi:TPA: hypothetical protein U1B91_000251 [Streptococcus suis]|uniref:hypothetical protein n=1 Tax=Streptococcus suis TaxID=1307 RepID=UPI000CF3B3D3|nr:hypothetical protein [Streptococcus suis]MCK4023927.1 hypothetical protein [Streptococcus suis]MCO8200846.1 hypothetical protein [Streptococcus suis]MCO8218383.1 hypothetical protein [Streptococcus suis]HEM3467933.1 hypothetical protein [Streptococcus suis]HEM3478644.1 hypothetical protein [Streptococcus suis]
MDIAVRLVTFIGVLGTLGGLFSMASGAYNFFSGRKLKNDEKRDQGQEEFINGLGIAVSFGTICSLIVAAIQNLTF